MLRKTAIIPLSGGIDSSTCISYATHLGFDVYAVFIDYGQNNLRHEVEAANHIADYYKVKEIKILTLDWFKKIGGTGLTDASHLNQDNKKMEYVPFRNSIILSLAMAWAEAINANAIFYGSTGPPWITPDNSPEYFDAFRRLASIATMKKNIEILSPFNEWNKSQVIELGVTLGVPYQLTWSCHNDGENVCQECSQCLDRIQGFSHLGIEDPCNKSTQIK